MKSDSVIDNWFIDVDVFRDACQRLAFKIKEHQKIYAISLGGIFPAAQLGYINGIRDIDVLKPPLFEGITTPGIVIDDIYDSGKTYVDLRNKYPEIPIAVLISKTKDHPKDLIVGHYVLTKRYVRFEWE